MKTRQSVLVSSVVALLIVVGMPASATLGDETVEERLTKLEKRLDEEKAAREEAERKLKYAEEKLKEQTELVKEMSDVVKGFCILDPGTKRLKPSWPKMMENPDTKKEFDKLVWVIIKNPPKAIIRLENSVGQNIFFRVNSDPSKKRTDSVAWDQYPAGNTEIEVTAGTVEYQAWGDPAPKRVNLEPGQIFPVPVKRKAVR